MGEDIGDRLKWIRGELDLSQRAIAEQVGCSLRGWQSWEYGRTSPSADVLGRLVELGFDGGWLLTGRGDPRRGAGQGGVASGDPQLMEEISQLRAAGLDDLFLLARRGTQATLWRLLQVLHEEPGRPASPQELRDRLKSDGDDHELADVVADCRLLVMHGLVIEIARGRETLYAVAPGAVLKPTQAVDVLQAVREIVRTLGVRVLPALRRRNRTGYLSNIEIRAPQGKGRAVLAAIRQAAVDFVESPDQDGPERVFVAIGIAVDEEGDLPA